MSPKRVPSVDKVRITGPPFPDQTEDEVTSTPSAAVGTPVATGVDAVGAGGVAAGVASTVRRTAIIASDDVPNGKCARIIPAASTR